MSDTTPKLALKNLILGTIAFALSFIAFSIIAPFAKTFQEQFDLSYTQTMLLTGLPVVLGSLLRLPMGIWTDRYGGRRMFTILLVISAIPMLLFGFANTYAQLLLVGLFLGIAGSSFAVGVPFVSGWFSREKQGFTLGIYGLGNGGTSIAFLGAPIIVSAWGRNTLGIAGALVLVAFAIIFYLIAEDAPSTGKKQPSSYGKIMKAGARLHRLSFFYFIAFGGFITMGLLLPTVLQDWFSLTPADAAARAAGFVILATLGRPLGGWLADKLGGYFVLVLVYAVVIADAGVLAALSSVPQIVPVTIASLTMGVAFGIGSGAVFKLVAEEFPQTTGAAGGIVGAAGGLGGFFPLIFVGVLHDATDTYAYGFVSLLVVVMICLVTAVWLLWKAGQISHIQHSATNS